MLKITTNDNSVNLIKDQVNIRTSKLGVLSYNFSKEGIGFYLPNSSTPFVSETFAEGVELNGEAITADNVNEKLSQVFFLNDSSSDTAAIEEHNADPQAHADIRALIPNAANFVTLGTQQTISGPKIFNNVNGVNVRSATAAASPIVRFTNNAGAGMGSVGSDLVGGYAYLRSSGEPQIRIYPSKDPTYYANAVEYTLYHAGNLDVPAYEQRISELESQVQELETVIASNPEELYFYSQLPPEWEPKVFEFNGFVITLEPVMHASGGEFSGISVHLEITDATVGVVYRSHVQASTSASSYMKYIADSPLTLFSVAPTTPTSTSNGVTTTYYTLRSTTGDAMDFAFSTGKCYTSAGGLNKVMYTAEIRVYRKDKNSRM